ncbi:MAG: methyltransferase domain-containing protein [Candidatus Paceibacterota bacterium]|jgi:2-polyprenyl-3-methyl-5-hydroxy-6-metoxy-1,4-benzoquinol methylase
MTINSSVTQRCIACDSEKNYKQGIQTGYVEGLSYDIYVCDECCTSWASPHSSQDSVYNLIYKNRKDAPGYMRYYIYSQEILSKKNPFKYLARQEEMYYGLYKALRGKHPSSSRVLDVGCGLGYVTYALKKANYNVTGLDISSNAIEEAKKMYGDYFVCEDFFQHNPKEGKYDVICMLELIEHVEDPAYYINHAMSLLSPNGILILTTPNKSFYPKGSLWETDAPPVHITWFGELGISKLCSNLGLKSLFISFTIYNILFGTVRKSFSQIVQERTPIFSINGEPLYSRYKKSKLRMITEKYYVYGILKLASKITKKITDIVKLPFSFSSYTGSKSNIICVIISKSS